MTGLGHHGPNRSRGLPSFLRDVPFRRFHLQCNGKPQHNYEYLNVVSFISKVRNTQNCTCIPLVCCRDVVFTQTGDYSACFWSENKQSPFQLGRNSMFLRLHKRLVHSIIAFK